MDSLTEETSRPSGMEEQNSLSPTASVHDHAPPSLSSEGAPLTLVDLLQPTSFSNADFSSAATTSYLDQLLSLSLHELLRQPALITAESSTVESDLTNLCFREYPTFISVHKCSSAVRSAFDDFSGSLGKLIGAIPSLENECRSFSTTTGSIQRVRGKAALVQEHQDKLLDLLELPQLMETCVRNGYYQEALELLNHCHSLAQRYPTVALVQDVAKEVEGILQLMLAQLIALLREPVKLPALVKTVSFLRRLDAMDESELGLVFISSRYYNFRTQLLSIERDKSEPVRYLRRYIDLFREHVYDIIAQFTAIFLESSHSDIAAVHITSFANQAISELVELVTAFVPRIASDSASMSSILVQLGYCAMSFARVGLDFAPLISAPFSASVLATFSQSLATSATEFSSILRDSAKAVLPPSQILVAAEHIPAIVSSSSSPPPLPPIESASHFPPIASLINAHLAAFNNLRLLAPLALHTQLTSLHSASILASTGVLLQYITQATSLTEPPAGPSKDKRSHTRTPSAPRADLLRRNSEVQMTPEARAAKRREAKRVCVASADVWCRLVVPFLLDKLNDGVFADLPAPLLSKELEVKLDELKVWVKENGEGVADPHTPPVNGQMNPPPPPQSPPAMTRAEVTNGVPETPPPLSRAAVLSTPLTFVSPFKATSHAAEHPHSNGIDAVFDSPREVSPSARLRGKPSGSTVPEPAILRDSAEETVQNMEAQLEAMSLGLSGEEAAISSEIKHVSVQDPHRDEVITPTPESDEGVEKRRLADGVETGSNVLGLQPALDLVKVEQPKRLIDVVPPLREADLDSTESSAQESHTDNAPASGSEDDRRPTEVTVASAANEEDTEATDPAIKSRSSPAIMEDDVDVAPSIPNGQVEQESGGELVVGGSQDVQVATTVESKTMVQDGGEDLQAKLVTSVTPPIESAPVTDGYKQEQTLDLSLPGGEVVESTALVKAEESETIIENGHEGVQIPLTKASEEAKIAAQPIKDHVSEDNLNVVEAIGESAPDFPTGNEKSPHDAIPPAPTRDDRTSPAAIDTLKAIEANASPAETSEAEPAAQLENDESAPPSVENSRPPSPNAPPPGISQPSNASKKKKKKKKGKS